MNVGTLVKDKNTGQYLVTVSAVSTPPVGGPRVRVAPHRRAKSFLVWTSDVEAVPKEKNPFRRTYSQWVLFVIAEVLTLALSFVSVRALQDHGFAWWGVLGFAASATATFNTVVYRLFGLHR